MSSLFRDVDLDDLPPEKRYAPVREPHVQAAEDMRRYITYDLGKKEPDSDPPPPKPNRVDYIAAVEFMRVDYIAELMRALTYGEMIELAAAIWAKADGEITIEKLPQILWDWSVKP